MGDDGIDKSGYNEASYKMIRLDLAQKIIAVVKQDLIEWYDEKGGYGYKIMRIELDNLISEIWGKMGDVEKEKIRELRDLYDEGLIIKPIYVYNTIRGIGDSKKTKQINAENYKWLCSLLFEFHMYINELLEKAGYSTFTVDTFDGDPYN